MNTNAFTFIQWRGTLCRLMLAVACIVAGATSALATGGGDAVNCGDPNTFCVTSKLDDGEDGPLLNPCKGEPDCTLREAINRANAHVGMADLIAFQIPGCLPCTIELTPMMPLPALLDSGTTIDGFTQPGSQGTFGSGHRPGVQDYDNPCQNLYFKKADIAIDANNNIKGLTIAPTASNILLKGMAVYNVGTSVSDDTMVAVEAQGGPVTGTNRVLESMLIGLLPNGSKPADADRNASFGARQTASVSTPPIGQYHMEVRWSVASHNGRGGIDGEDNGITVIKVTDDETYKNGWDAPAHDGIDMNGINSVARCNYSYKNTNANGIQPTGGSGGGLELGSKNRTGDFDNNLAEYNTLYMNLSSGLSIRSGPRANTARKNVIWGNQVGVSVDAEAAGGTKPTNRNALDMNSIFGNHTLGIDLRAASVPPQWVGNPDGKNINDHCDVDGGVDGSSMNTGSNDLQNYPDLTSVKRMKTKTFIWGQLDSTPLRTYRIEFFSTPTGTSDLSPSEGPAADREGKFFLGFQIVGPIDASCIVQFSATVPFGVPDNHRVTATARMWDDTVTTMVDESTEPWSTSEFSALAKVFVKDHDDFDSDGKRDDEDSDDDSDGKKDDEDSDDDNDGKHDDDDSDDDSDGCKDRHDSKSHREKHKAEGRRAKGHSGYGSHSTPSGVQYGLGLAPLFLILTLRKRSRAMQVMVILAAAASVLVSGGVAQSQEPDESVYTYTVTTDINSLLLIADAQKTKPDALLPEAEEVIGGPLDLLEQPLVVEIYDPLGTLVATSLPIPGPAMAATVPVIAGDYTVKVRNIGTDPIDYDLTTIIRESWDVPELPELPPPPPPPLP